MSVTIQEKVCLELADRKGVKVGEVFIDNDRGASTLSKKKRPKFEEMLQRIRLGEFSHILAYSSSRLTRRPLEYETIIQLAVDTGVRVYTDRSGDPDFTTADGRAVARTIAAWDAAEAERTGERVKANVQHRVQRGENLGGIRPFGFELDRATPHPVEAAVVAGAYEVFLQVGSVYAVTAYLNRSGLTTTQGKEWGWSSAKKLLQRTRNMGVIQHHGQVVRENGIRIVDPIVFESAQALLRGRARTTTGPKHVALLSGILTCGRCGAAMHNGGAYYRCAVKAGTTAEERAQRQAESMHPTITRSIADERVRQMVFMRMGEMAAKDALTPESPEPSNRVVELRLELAEVARQRDAAQEIGTMPGANLIVLRERLQEFADRIEAIETEIANVLEESARETIRDLVRESLFELNGVTTFNGPEVYPAWKERFEALPIERRREIVTLLAPWIKLATHGRGAERLRFGKPPTSGDDSPIVPARIMPI